MCKRCTFPFSIRAAAFKHILIFLFNMGKKHLHLMQMTRLPPPPHKKVGDHLFLSPIFIVLGSDLLFVFLLSCTWSLVARVLVFSGYHARVWVVHVLILVACMLIFGGLCAYLGGSCASLWWFRCSCLVFGDHAIINRRSSPSFSSTT